MKISIFDLEVYPNLFVAVFYDPYQKSYTNFICWEDKINQLNELKIFLKDNSDTYFVGYNSLGYDMNILTEIVNKKLTTNKEIKDFNDYLISQEWPVYREEDFCNKTIDLMLVNNYGPRSAKSTSLKKLEFNMRKKNIKDLPYHFNDLIDNNKKVEEVIKYCEFDVEQTYEVLKISKDLIKLRIEFGELNNLNLLNSTEADIGKKYFYKTLSEMMGITIKEFKYLRSYYDEIHIKDVILPYIKFDLPIYNEVLDFYNNTVLTATVKSAINENKKVVNLKKVIEKTIEYKGLKTVYAAGGIHGAPQSGIYESNDEYMIVTMDFASYYPHLQFINGISPNHIPPNIYCGLLQELYNKRKSYDKKTHYILNYSMKILINLIYGLSNSEYGALYDTKATLATTVNGMLILSMIADKVYTQLDNALVLSKNTDGIEVYVKRTDYNNLIAIFDEIENLTKIPYEIDEYQKYIIRDINNYIAITPSGKVKVKGVFETYEDIISLGAYHKDTSASIIPLALQNYFVKNIPVEETILNHNNIYDFCYGAKGSSQYKWHITEYNPTKKVAVSKLFDHRFLRYYAGGTETLSQYWTKGKKEGTIQAIQANTPITLALNLPKADIHDYNKKGERIFKYNSNGELVERYPDLDRSWYIEETYKIINQIEKPELI